MGTKTAEQRKAGSIAIVRAQGVPWIEHLPMLHEEDAAVVRSAGEVLARVRGCLVYFLWGQLAMDGKGPAELRAMLERHGMDVGWAEMSPDERRAVEAEAPSRQDLVSSSWAVEAVYVLLWAVGLVDGGGEAEGNGTGRLGWPRGVCDPGEVFRINKAAKSAEGLRVRPVGELLDELDLYYRLMWAVRDSGLKGGEVEGVNGSLVFERRRALEWLVGEKGEDGVG